MIRGEEGNPSDDSMHLTRRARGLPLWFPLAVNGTDASAQVMDQAVATAAWASRIEASPHLELLRHPDLSVVIFKRVGWTAEDYDRGTGRSAARVSGPGQPPVSSARRRTKASTSSSVRSNEAIQRTTPVPSSQT